MKAIEVSIGSRVSKCVSEKHSPSGYSYPEGVVICNVSRQGDEVLIIEWDDGFSVSTYNVNDLETVNGIELCFCV